MGILFAPGLPPGWVSGVNHAVRRRDVLRALAPPDPFHPGRGLGLGVWGLGCGVWDLGFGVWGLEFVVCGLGFRIWDLDSGF